MNSNRHTPLFNRLVLCSQPPQKLSITHSCITSFEDFSERLDFADYIGVSLLLVQPVMPEIRYYGSSSSKPPKSNAYRCSPAKLSASPAHLAAVSGATDLKPNAGAGRKEDWFGNGKYPVLPCGANYEVAIPAVPLRSVPAIDVKRKPEKTVSSLSEDHDEGRNKKAKTKDNIDHQKDDLWKNESVRLAAVIAEAKEFMSLFDAKHTMAPTFLSVDDFLKDSKNQLPLLEHEERDRDKSFAESGKRLKLNSGKDFGAENMTVDEDEDEVVLLSSEEWKVLHLHSSNKDECAKPSILKSETSIVDPISVGTKPDQPREGFSNCGSSDSDECSPKSHEEQDESLETCYVDDDACETYSTNSNCHEFGQKHKGLVNMEIVTHDDPRGRKVMEALKLFREEYDEVSQDRNLDKAPHFVAAQRVKERGMVVSTDKPFGHVPGIEIGDEFSFRAELVVVGLNRQYTPGIDFVRVDGKTYATCVVNSGRFENKAKEDDILIYTGEGGNPNCSSASADQQLLRGNLALFNSINMGFPVRVIHKRMGLDFKSLGNGKHNYVYVYDGLYKVNRYWYEREFQSCNMVYKFELQRLPGQPRVHGANVEFNKQIQFMDVGDVFHGKKSFGVVNGMPGQPSHHHAADMELGKDIQAKEDCGVLQERESQRSNRGINVKRGKPIQTKDVCVLDDVSKGREKFKVRVVNGGDEDPPPPFTYITNIIYPCWHWLTEPISCDCINGCSDSVKCPCVRMNGGEIPYTENGKLMRASRNKPVHECGPLCKCPPSCMNRVSQHGPRFQLEIFKTKAKGWGVRSRDYIKPGSFICEYIGELLEEKEANQRINNDQYLFDICHNDLKEDDYALDAAKSGNIGRFINHSCDPNVFAQEVLYDHNDKKMPHIMFFASKCIPPRQELTYDYNYKKIRVRDANGNIRRKDCHCGSLKCTGRLY